MRPDIDQYFSTIAHVVKTRSTCSRDQIGAVVVRDGHIVSTGYNGSAPGEPHCIDGGCPRGQLSLDDCARDASYANCVAIHAELNALLRAGHDKTNGATLYTTRTPCHECARAVKAAGIARVVVS